MNYNLEYSESELGDVYQYINEFDTKYNIATMIKPIAVHHINYGTRALQEYFAPLFQAPTAFQSRLLVTKICKELKDAIYAYGARMAGRPIDNSFVAPNWENYFEDELHRTLVRGALAGTGTIPPNTDIDTLITNLQTTLILFLHELYNPKTEALDNYKKKFPQAWLIFLVEEVRDKLLKERSKPKPVIFKGFYKRAGSRRKSIRNKRRRSSSRSQRF